MAFNGELTKRKERKCLLPFVLFVIFSTFGDIFLTFHFFRRWRLTTREESPDFCLKSIFQSWCKVCSQRKFHVAVVQQWLRNVIQKSVWCTCKVVVSLIYINLLLFCCPCSRHHCSLLLWSRNVATMVMWCHTSPLHNTHFPYFVAVSKHVLMSSTARGFMCYLLMTQ